MWRKSSRSHANGNCVEVTWRKSRRSYSDGQCVEVAAPWRKSSRSNGHSECVEATSAPAAAVLVRDTKNPHSGYLTFSPEAWRDFVALLCASGRQP